MGKILINLCLSDLPKNYIKEVTFANGEKKKFINIVVSEMQTPDERGNDYTIYAYKSKEHKDDTTTWLGKGKTMMPKEASGNYAAPAKPSAPNPESNLPF